MADRSDLETARQAGRFVGALLDSSPDMCPWTRDERVDLQGAWFTGFQEGRWARIQIDAAEWPPIEISLDVLKGRAE
ncbi:hypothetical protein GCM10011390_51210 [Aureimonas endophytica]|uniref:Uncharacterized protein n=1 Tax=Aureimonas endophytica TaxID=2027858 RepID=A0A917A648_9HYPH|nr:hypothetical protein [Aureimonas endophytica]GGE25513.1 hypothetical protein GCM10011390_51210 [Aureimonas endophytica]